MYVSTVELLMRLAATLAEGVYPQSLLTFQTMEKANKEKALEAKTTQIAITVCMARVRARVVVRAGLTNLPCLRVVHLEIALLTPVSPTITVWITDSQMM